jgi:isoleucyl-tRNA synthetase
MLEGVVKKFEDYIQRETLSVSVGYGLQREYIECNINGEKLNISVEVVK